jgi:hypothetical protein
MVVFSKNHWKCSKKTGHILLYSCCFWEILHLTILTIITNNLHSIRFTQPKHSAQHHIKIVVFGTVRYSHHLLCQANYFDTPSTVQCTQLTFSSFFPLSPPICCFAYMEKLDFWPDVNPESSQPHYKIFGFGQVSITSVPLCSK